MVAESFVLLLDGDELLQFFTQLIHHALVVMFISSCIIMSRPDFDLTFPPLYHVFINVQTLHPQGMNGYEYLFHVTLTDSRLPLLRETALPG